MIIISSENVDQVLWRLRELQKVIEATPTLLGRQRQVGQYLIQLGSMGHLYAAFNEIMEIVVAATDMAQKLDLKDYSIVIEPNRAYITPERLPELFPPLPKIKPSESVKEPEVEINKLGCKEVTPEFIKFCVKNIEIAYFIGSE